MFRRGGGPLFRRGGGRLAADDFVWVRALLDKEKLNQLDGTLHLKTWNKLLKTHLGNTGPCRFFQMNPTAAAMAPRTTSVTMAMATATPVETEQTSVCLDAAAITNVIILYPLYRVND